jgi:hypothetical protein
MQATLGTLLDRLQGFFGKAFFLAGFLPMVVFLTLNALLTAAVFPDVGEDLQRLLTLGEPKNVLNWLGLILLAYILGLMVWSLNPTMRQFLEGRYLPTLVRKRLIGVQQKQLHALLEQRRSRVEEIFDFRRVSSGDDAWTIQLRNARKAGENHDPAEVSEAVRDASRDLQERRNKLDVIEFAAMENLFKLLKSELTEKPADKIPALDMLHQDFRELQAFARQTAEARLTRTNSELGIRFPQDAGNLGPTRLANQAEVQREYGLRRYGLDIELYWLRLQKIARGDDHFFPVLEDAKTQLDFSVSAVALLGLLTVAWILLSLIFSTTLTLFLLLAVIGPLSTWLFSHVVVQNYRGFAEAVRSAVDLYRFDLLTTLHVPLPPDSRKEKQVWMLLMESAVGDTDHVLSYVHDVPDQHQGNQADQPDGTGR